MSKGENFIHLKFEHEEVIQSRRDLLTSEIDLINVAKSFERFMALRALELKTKAKLVRELKRIETDIKKLEKGMPEVEIPKILKQGTPKKREQKEEDIEGFKIKTPKSNDLESQLMEIQRKLKELSG